MIRFTLPALLIAATAIGSTAVAAQQNRWTIKPAREATEYMHKENASETTKYTSGAAAP